MSEDIDFKLALPTSWSRSQARRKLSGLSQRTGGNDAGCRFRPNGSRHRDQAERDPDDDILVRHLYDVHERFVGELVWGEPVPFAEDRAGFVALTARLLRGLDPPP